MRRVLLAACCALPLLAAEDPKEMVRRALTQYVHDNAVERQYTYLQRDDVRMLDGAGKIKHRDLKTFDVTLLEGSRYERLIKRNDQPLSAAEEHEQQEALKRSIDERSKETAWQHSQRMAEWDRKQHERLDEFKEVPDAFDFKLAGEDTIDGVPVWIIDGKPHPGYKPKSKTTGYFLKMQGRMWVTKSDYHAVHIDVVTMEPISIGAFLIRFAKGGHIQVEFTRVNGDVWMPKRVALTGSARVLVVKGYHMDAEFTFSDYKKFSTESRVLDSGQ
jgi:hypothetical protein